MKYSGFNLKNTDEKEQIKNRFRQRQQSGEVVYRAEYPGFVKKRELIRPESKSKMAAAAECQTVENIETEETSVEQRGKSSFTGVLCGILATILCFTAVYLSGIKAPVYVQKGVLALVEYARIGSKNEVRAAAKEKNTKTIGGKLFVEKTEQNSQDEFNIGVPESENSKFAQTIMESGKKEEKKESEAQVQVMSEQENDNDEKTVEVIARNMSKGSDKIYFTNRTELELDFDKILLREYPIEKYAAGNADEPLVLIVHTHGTEGYINSASDNVTRSTDTEKNVVRIGRELTDVLEAYGIPVIHSESMHDEISYIKAYDNSKAEVARYLSEYPSIKYVIDLHRDALGSDGETPIKTYTSVNGESSAQLMFVMGTNAAGGNHPNYMNNLTVAANLQTAANELYPGLMRPINVRPIIFNQNLADGCMILEVGSDANTIEEALAAVRMFGRCFAQTVCE